MQAKEWKPAMDDFLSRGDYEQGLAYFNHDMRATYKRDEDFLYHVGMLADHAGRVSANLFMKARRYLQALFLYSKILWLPDQTNGYLGIGRVFGYVNFFTLARFCYARVLSRRPEHTGALTALGNVHKARRRYQEAIEYYEKAIDAGAPYGTYFNLARLLHEVGATERALIVFEQGKSKIAQQVRSSVELEVINALEKDIKNPPTKQLGDF